MAQYEHLQIYRDAFNYLVFCEHIAKDFSRYNKYTHGTDLRNTAKDVAKLIVRANNSADKTPVLEELRLKIEECKLIIRICKELKVFRDFKSFENAVNQLSSISRQAEGWLKSMRYKRNSQNQVSNGSNPIGT
ncbi:MAG: four helix bundle protein [Desulfobacterales bacterium]|nr:four helix bundle protein [Desulfobacterales bacterium]